MKNRPSFPGRVTHGVRLSPPVKGGDPANRLFQRRVDLPKASAQAAADAVDRSDDSQRNTGCDQAVFNGGSAGLIGENPFENALQLYLPKGVVWIILR
jgi:hypothetical protein